MEASNKCNAKADESTSYFVGTDLISDAWNACQSAYKCRDFYENEYKKNFLIIAFSGSQNSRDYVTDNDFDECAINNNNEEFKCMGDGDFEDQKPAVVRKAFLDRFLCILRSSKLKTKVFNAWNEKKTIIFTGHSFGGAIASLWTLWTLDRYNTNSPRCITFGCPLVGDKIFARSIERENWSRYFCHIVSKHDIVPRICFSPFKSPPISKALEELLPYWYDSMKNQIKAENRKTENQKPVQDGSYPLSKDNSQEFIKQVISDASQVLTHETTALVVGPANLVGGAVKDLIKRSPYRPFGYYVFCSSSGSVCCIENTETTLHMLYFALENSKLFGACIMEHIEYEKTIKHISKSSGLTASYSKTVKSDKSSAAEVRIDLQLEAMGIGNQNVQAWLGLKAIEDNKNKLTTNMEQQSIKLDEMQDCMAELEWYKTICEEDNLPGYYDCFKTHKRENKIVESNANESMSKLAESNATESMPKLVESNATESMLKFAELNEKLRLAQLNANKSRLKLAAFWDRITELVEKEELPKDLQTQDKWIDAGTEYRLLVEPLDIAHYYRLGKHEDSRSYLVNGRPRRYKLLQKWLHGKKRKGRTESRARTQPPFLTQDSCFWAYVEDADYSIRVPDSSTAEELRAFQKRLEKMMDCHEISLEVFSSNSTFMKWWNSFKVNLSKQDQQNFSNKLSSYASALN